MLPNTNSILNEDEISSFTKIMNTKYASYLQGRFFEINVHSESDRVHTVITLRNASDRFYYPVEASMAYKEQDLSIKDAALFLIDYTDFYFDEFFKEDEEVLLTIDWSPHTFEEKKFYMKGQIFNKEREKLAEEWLDKNNS